MTTTPTKNIRRAATLMRDHARGGNGHPGTMRTTTCTTVHEEEEAHPGAVSARALPSSKQQGALFGLDARIALAIFSILSVVAGVAVVVNIDSTRGQVLATELADTAHALESFHNDLKTDIFLTLTIPSGKNAYQALYDSSVITDGQAIGDGANLRARWNGPYIKFTTNLNSRYGDMFLTKAGPDHTQPCAYDNICYLYIVYSRVKPNIAAEANKILDGEAEKSPEKEGRIQWSDSGDGTNALHFRALRALSQTMDY